MRLLAAAAIFACSLVGPAGAQPAPDSGTPKGLPALAVFVGQWTCVTPTRPKGQTWTIAYGEGGAALHISIVGTETLDVYLVAHPSSNDLYAFGVGTGGWEFSRSPAFDGKSLTFASIQTNDGSSVTHALTLLGPAAFTAKTDVTPATGDPFSITESCTKA
jgi:hypothetical protein